MSIHLHINSNIYTIFYSYQQGCEVWYFFDYHKTYMSYDQIYKAIRAAHDDDAEKTIRLLKRGNNTAGGMIIDPDKYYLISTYGRLACVTNTGEMKLVGTITQEQYTRVVLNCIDQGTLVKQDINFPLADLVQKHFDSLDGKPIDMVNFVTDHRNFRRRDNHIRNLFKNTHRGNCKRKKSNTLLVSKLYCNEMILILVYMLTFLLNICHQKGATRRWMAPIPCRSRY